ncbi:MAG: SagB/ThcOx family dehydrogenase [Pirellulales bacterium]|nr:SagB/ThcOx family dehydrogenase [Pirellulales bacterium]
MPHDPRIDEGRQFLKDTVRQTLDFSEIDQYRGIAPPPVEKPFAPDARRIDLCAPGRWKGIGPVGLETAIGNRESRRRYTGEPLILDELSFLLWATQGIRRRLDSGSALRTVPSAGARHVLETYLCVFSVEGLDPAFYRYLPVEHQLLFEFQEKRAAAKLAAAALGQAFVGQAAVTFIWTALPYRMEWRYGAAAHKAIALDAGHVCQNLYLACEAIGAGTCAVAAYHQEAMDELLRVDGKDEFTVYLAPVGKVWRPGMAALR